LKNISFLMLFNLAIKNLWILIICAVITAAGTFGFCEYVAVDRYSATGSVIVTNGTLLVQREDKTGISNTDVVASVNFSETIKDILNTNGIFKKLASALDNKYTYEQLKAASKIEKRSEDSLFIDVTFESTDKEEAKRMVNEYLKFTDSYIEEFIEGAATISVSDADAAKKVYPNTVTSTILISFGAVLICFSIIVLVHSYTTVIKDEDSFKEMFNIPVLGNVPDFDSARKDKKYSYYGKGGNN